MHIGMKVGYWEHGKGLKEIALLSERETEEEKPRNRTMIVTTIKVNKLKYHTYYLCFVIVNLFYTHIHSGLYTCMSEYQTVHII